MGMRDSTRRQANTFISGAESNVPSKRKSDSWRVRPGLTLNLGVRWEAQGSFVPHNGSYTLPSVDDVWGVSGPGNLFKPGVMTGRVTPFYQFKEGGQSYNTDRGNFAPSFGFAWSPKNGKTVVRGGYAIAYNRRGIGEFRTIISTNPGIIITTNRDLANGNLGQLP